MIWQLSDAARAVELMSDVFKDNGYLLALYGSCLKGSGRDLDLLAIPWRPNPTPPSILEPEICMTFALIPSTEPPYEGLMKSWNQIYTDPLGRLIDLQIRKSTVTLEESFEYSMKTGSRVPSNTIPAAPTPGDPAK